MIIVDDESPIRDYFPLAYDWEGLGFQIVGVLEDGRDAIEFIKTNAVDVVLSDIKMTHISGLELAQYIFINHPRIKTLLLSGYENFEYAKKAIDFGVYSYLLKPSKKAEINEVFSKLKKELDKQHSVNYNQNFIADLIAQKVINEISTKYKIENENVIMEYIRTEFKEIKMLEQNSEGEAEFIRNSKNKILQFIVNDNYATLKEYTNSIFEESDNFPFYIIREIILFLFLAIELELYKKGVEIYELENKKISFLNLICIKEKNELITYTQEVLNYLIEKNMRKQLSSKNKFINQVKDIIIRDYNKNLSLDDVSKEIFLSGMYIGRIFKEQTGMSFTDYIIKVRIDKAKDLLKSNLYKVYEVSEMVGYKNIKHFNKNFKNSTGFTPREYKDME
jgi:two-component system response regulator YesN